MRQTPLFLPDCRSICFRARLLYELRGETVDEEVAASLAMASATSRSLGALGEFLLN